MNVRRILTGTVVLGIVHIAIGWLMMKFVWGTTFSSLSWVNPTPPMRWLFVADFAAAFMLMVAWDRFGTVSGTGAAAGFKFGLFAGAFVSFPAVLVWQVWIKDFPYATAWELLVVMVLTYGVLGAVAAMLDGKSAAA